MLFKLFGCANVGDFMNYINKSVYLVFILCKYSVIHHCEVITTYWALNTSRYVNPSLTIIKLLYS